MINFILYNIIYHLKYLLRSGNNPAQYIFIYLALYVLFAIPLHSILLEINVLQEVIISGLYIIVYVFTLEKYYSSLLSMNDLYLYFNINKTYKITSMGIIMLIHFIIYGIPMSMTLTFINYIMHEMHPSYQLYSFFSYILMSWVLTNFGLLAYSLTFKLKIKSVLLSIIIIPIYIPLSLVLLNFLQNIDHITFDYLYIVFSLIAFLSLIFFILSVKALNYFID